MAFSLVLDIDKDIIQIYNDKDIKLFCKNLIAIALEGCQSVSPLKRYYQIFEMTVSSLEKCFLLISFTNSYLVISICEFELSKLLTLF